MLPSGLVDTGALLALLDANDRWHQACLDAFAKIRPPLLTSEACLTELFHLVGDSPRDVAAAWRLLHSGAVTIGPIGDADLPALETLMARYRDRPMDFADATLVLLARRERLDSVFTVDNDDFETYRIDGRRRFRVIPGRVLR